MNNEIKDSSTKTKSYHQTNEQFVDTPLNSDDTGIATVTYHLTRKPTD